MRRLAPWCAALALASACDLARFDRTYETCVEEQLCVDDDLEVNALSPPSGHARGSDGAAPLWLRWTQPANRPAADHFRVEVTGCPGGAFAVENCDDEWVTEGVLDGESHLLENHYPGERLAWRVRVCREDGVCTVPTAPRYLKLRSPRGPVPGDFDGDGRAEVVIGGPEPDAVADAVHVFRFAGDGPLELLMSFDEGEDNFGSALAVGDFNGDGLMDLAIAAQGGANPFGAVWAYHGGPGGPGPSSATGRIEGGESFGHRIAAGDFDGDGYSDLIVAEPDPLLPRVWFIPGSVTGLVPVVMTAISPPGGSGAFARNVASAGDLDGDGVDDLAVADGANGEVFIYAGQGGFPGPLSVTFTGHPELMAGIGDMDGDGYEDFALARADATSLQIQRGGATFEPGRLYHLDGGVWALSPVDDFNGNGFVDLLLGRGLIAGGREAPDGGWWFLEGGWTSTGVGDVDGDGRSDAVIVSDGGEVRLLRNDGTQLLEHAILEPAGTLNFGATVAKVR